MKLIIYFLLPPSENDFALNLKNHLLDFTYRIPSKNIKGLAIGHFMKKYNLEENKCLKITQTLISIVFPLQNNYPIDDYSILLFFRHGLCLYRPLYRSTCNGVFSGFRSTHGNTS